MATKNRCHYDVLNVSRDCGEHDLRKAYRTAALKYHPDKNRGREEEAEEEFKLVQEAFEVLSDAHERAWYDSHRDQILRGKQPGDDDEEGVAQATEVELMDYFTSSCYNGYNDEEDGFYTVYRIVFMELAKEEVYAAGRSARLSFAEFGTSDSTWSGVKQFYAQWESFSSSKLFGFVEKWNLSEAENREVRRAMDKENKKARAKAKKEYNVLVRELVMFVKKRDPRVKRQKKVEDQAKADREEEVRIRKEEEKARKKEWAEASKEDREKAMEEDAAGLDEILASIALDDEKEKKKNRRKMRNTNGDEQEEQETDEENEDIEVDEDEDQDQYCIACKKKFRTLAQFENHNSTKKHRQAMNRLRRQIEKEDRLFFDARDDESILVDTSRGNDIASDGNGNGIVESEEMENVEESVAMESKSQKKKKKKKNAKLQQMQSSLLDEDNNGDIGNTHNQQTTEGTSEKRTMSKRAKRKERERRKAGQEKTHACNVCTESFPSRTKLMKHVEKSGHARPIA